MRLTAHVETRDCSVVSDQSSWCPCPEFIFRRLPLQSFIQSLPLLVCTAERQNQIHLLLGYHRPRTSLTRYSTQGSITAVSLPISARRGAHGADEFSAHVAVIAESALEGDRGDGLVGFDQKLADFADAKLADVS
jgi:hypothetical protein